MIAVIVLNWNGGEDTLACLRSVYASDYPGEVAVYLLDNASTDGSFEATRAAFPRAKAIQNGGNLGFAGGNNPGWRAAVADGARWVFFLNNDAEIAPDCLRTMVEVCEANPRIGAASPKIFHGAMPGPGEPDDSDSREVWFEKGQARLDLVCGLGHVVASAEERASAWYESPLATGCGLLMRAETLSETGGFDEGLFAYYEDVDLSLRVRKLGLACAVVPAAHAWHKVSRSTGGALSPTSLFYLSRNGHLLIRRHLERPEQWASYKKSFPKGAYGLVAIGVSKGMKGGLAALQGIIHGLQGRVGIRPSKPPGLALRAPVFLVYLVVWGNRGFRKLGRIARAKLGGAHGPKPKGKGFASSN